jgi:chemotaxis signal transduction protein
MSGVDAFLKEMQEEFLKDPENHLGSIKESIDKLSTDPVAGLKAIDKIVRAMKGNLEPLGFTFFAGLIGEFEKQVRELMAAYESLGGQHNGDDTRVLEFFLSDVYQNLEGYFQALRADGNDGEDKAEYRRPSVRILATWRPAAAVVAVTAPAPQVNVAVDSAPSAAQADKVEGENEESATARAAVHQFLMCRSGYGEDVSARRSFAIPVHQVLEVIEEQTVNPLPYRREGIAGILNFRGDPLPILICDDIGNEGAKTDDPQKGGRAGYIVISRIEDKTFGFQIEQVTSVSILEPGEFYAPEGLLTLSSASWVTHLVKVESEVVLVMDLKKALVA